MSDRVRAAGEKNRTEAFSDGVFAIAITLLILEIKVPHRNVAESNVELLRALLSLWPSFFAFLASFATILVMWINHHGLFSLLHRIDSRFLFANGFLLLLVTFIPFPTALLAEHLRDDSGNTAAVIYCGTYIVVSITYNLLLLAATSRPDLLKENIPALHLKKIARAYRFGTVWYSLITAIAWFHPLAGTILCSLLWLLWARLDYSVHEAHKHPEFPLASTPA